MDSQGVELLASVADLPLAAERGAFIAAAFSGLIDAANELSRKMADPHYRDIGPAITFQHASLAEDVRE